LGRSGRLKQKEPKTNAVIHFMGLAQQQHNRQAAIICVVM